MSPETTIPPTQPGLLRLGRASVPPALVMKPEHDLSSPPPRPRPPTPWDSSEVNFEQYCRLLVSRRRIERLTKAPPGYCGLRDPLNGQTYLVRELALPSAS